MKVHDNGPVLFVTHCFMFSVISAINKTLVTKISLFQMVFLQALVSVLVMLPFMVFVYRDRLTKQYQVWHAVRAFFWMIATVMYFYAVSKVALPKATAVVFSIPLFTTIFAVFFLKEALHLRRTLALFFGLIGMIVIISPGKSQGFEIEILWAVAAAFCWSITDIFIKVIGKRQGVVVTTFFFLTYATIFAAVPAILNWHELTNYVIYSVVLVGSLNILNMLLVTRAYQKSELTVIMPFSFSQLIFIAIISYFYFGEIMTINTVVGAFIIIASTSYMSYRESREHKVFLARQMGRKLLNIEKN